jgi:hypothetical protein
MAELLSRQQGAVALIRGPASVGHFCQRMCSFDSVIRIFVPCAVKVPNFPGDKCQAFQNYPGEATEIAEAFLSPSDVCDESSV